MQAVKRAVREEPGTSQKRICVRELTTAIINSNYQQQSPGSKSADTGDANNQATGSCCSEVDSNCFAVRHENGVFHFRYNAAMFHTICVALIK